MKRSYLYHRTPSSLTLISYLLTIIESRGYCMSIKWYEIRSVLLHFYWNNVPSCCEQFTKSPKGECNPLLPICSLVPLSSNWTQRTGWQMNRQKEDKEDQGLTHTKAVGQWNTIHFYIATPHYFLIPFEKNTLGLYCTSCQQLMPSYHRQNLLVKESGWSMGVSKNRNSLKKMEMKYL